MNCRGRRNVCALILGVVCIAAASLISIVNSYRSDIFSHRIVVLERGQTVLDALRAGILAHGRRGRYHGDRLAIIFEELARESDIKALELRDPDGKVIASGGQPGVLPEDAPEKPLWGSHKLVISSQVALKEACERCCARSEPAPAEEPDWVPFRNGLYVLTALLDVSEVDHAIERHRLQLGLSLAITLGALGLGLFSVLLMLKRTRLALELEQERERAGRQEQLAHLGAGLAHETKNPLGIIRGLAQAVGACAEKACPCEDHAKKIVDEVDRVIGGVNSFLALARPKVAALSEIDLDAFFDTFLPLVQMDASAAGVGVAYRPCGYRVRADGELLRRALLNLIINALRASRPGESVRIEAERTGGSLSLRVSDTGCGISAADLPHVTEPYFSRFSGGSGLGLSIVEQIATSHGWRLKLASVEGRGTQATLEGIALSEVP